MVIKKLGYFLTVAAMLCVCSTQELHIESWPTTARVAFVLGIAGVMLFMLGTIWHEDD